MGQWSNKDKLRPMGEKKLDYIVAFYKTEKINLLYILKCWNRSMWDWNL